MTLCSVALLLALHAADDAPWAPGGPSRPEDLVISLATIGPGDEVASMGGHSALAVVDLKLDQGRLYNFGVVDFSTDLMLRFVLGQLDFHADEAAIRQTYDAYRALNRDVRVQQLAFTPEQALAAANALATGVLPQNRTYRYQHFDDNCATRPRDVIDRALSGALSRATSGPARASLRDHARRYTQAFPVISVWLDLMQNDSIDRPITQRDEAFSPDELERQLDALVLDGHPFVKQRTTLFESTRPKTPLATPRWEVVLALLSLLFGGAAIALARNESPRARKLLGGLLAFIGVAWGTSGLLLFVLAFFTNQRVAHHNENLLFINPLTLALLPLGVLLFRGHPRAAPLLKWVTLLLAVGALLGVALKVLPAFDQQNANIIALVLPFSLACAVALRLRPASR